MVPGVGFLEYVVIAIVVLVVVGPRDLPRMAKTVGSYVRQARSFAKEFQKSFDEMGREIELDELRKEVEALKRGEPFNDIKRELSALDRDVRAVEREVSKPLPSPSKAVAPPPGATPTPDAAASPSETVAAPVPSEAASASPEPAAPEPTADRDVALKTQTGG